MRHGAHYRANQGDFLRMLKPPEPEQATVLLIGASVFHYLRRHLSAVLGSPVDLFATSMLPSDPAYINLLKGFMNPEGYDVILFSFGSHLIDRVFPPRFDEFERSFRQTAGLLRQRCRCLVVATSPSLMRTDDFTAVDTSHEAILLQGNSILARYAEETPGVLLADQHTWMQAQPRIDHAHFTPEGCRYQAEKIAALLASTEAPSIHGRADSGPYPPFPGKPPGANDTHPPSNKENPFETKRVHSHRHRILNVDN